MDGQSHKNLVGQRQELAPWLEKRGILGWQGGNLVLFLVLASSSSCRCAALCREGGQSFFTDFRGVGALREKKGGAGTPEAN